MTITAADVRTATCLRCNDAPANPYEHSDDPRKGNTLQLCPECTDVIFREKIWPAVKRGAVDIAYGVIKRRYGYRLPLRHVPCE